MMDNYRSWYIWLSLFFLILIGAGLLTEVYLVPRQKTLGKTAGENSRLELPNSRSVNVNDQFNLPVMLNTDGARIIGVDVVVKFNPTYLQLVDFIPRPQNGSLETFLPIDGSGNFDKSQLISGAGSGRIEFGAVAYRWSAEKLLNGFNGTLGVGNPLATLRFKALQSKSNTKVYFQATPGSTTDSNLVIQSGPTDILAGTTETDVSISRTPTNTTAPSGCKLCPPGNPMGVDALPQNRTDYQCNNNDHEATDYTACLDDFREVFFEGGTVEGYADYNCQGGTQAVDCTMALDSFRNAFFE